MKSKSFLICIFFLAFYSTLSAQNLIAVQGSRPTVFYQSLDSAFTHAQDGDTLYLSGGVFNLSKPLNKRLHMVGAGHYPDSTLTISGTYIQNELKIYKGANGSSITGISFGKSFLTFQENCDNFFISRCHVRFFAGNIVTNLLCVESIVLDIQLPSGNNIIFYNNIIEGAVYLGLQNTFKNNIFLCDQIFSNTSYISLYNSLFENNIFIAPTPTNAYYDRTRVQNNNFRNNLFVNNFPETTFFANYNNTGSGNIYNQTQSSIFVNQADYLFDYKHNYHLKSDSPGKNAGTDGKDIGIYGGPFPWKEGSVPFNPHISKFNLDSRTDPNGNLKINITVKAQER